LIKTNGGKNCSFLKQMEKELFCLFQLFVTKNFDPNKQGNLKQTIKTSFVLHETNKNNYKELNWMQQPT
jgi:hypothetical protein